MRVTRTEEEILNIKVITSKTIKQILKQFEKKKKKKIANFII